MYVSPFMEACICTTYSEYPRTSDRQVNKYFDEKVYTHYDLKERLIKNTSHILTILRSNSDVTRSLYVVKWRLRILILGPFRKNHITCTTNKI